MIEIRKAKDNKDIDGILTLQKQYLMGAENLRKDWSDGFVTLQHTPEILWDMIAESPQMVAVVNSEIVGYNRSMYPQMSTVFPILESMLAAFKDVYIDGRRMTEYSYVIGGQCCVSEDHRGKGLLERLYRSTRKEIETPCDFCVTEIARNNPRSLKAHLKFGFQVVHEYPGKEHVWDIVLWDWRKLR